MKREKDSLKATMSRGIGAKGRDTDVWAKKAEASTAEVSVHDIGTIMKSIRLATTNTNQTLIGIGSNVKHLRI